MEHLSILQRLLDLLKIQFYKINKRNYLHSNWIIHRDLKPSNILVMGDGEEQGVVKIADFGLARIYLAPLKPLINNGVVVTIWYRAPELLLGAKHYTSAVDMWAVGCIFAELITLKPLFQGVEAKGSPNPFQFDQLDKIFKVLGHPTTEKWPALVTLPHWQSNKSLIQGHKYENVGLHSVVPLNPKSAAYDLLSKMLEYDPRKRITAVQALEHEYFRMDPLPGRNALTPAQHMDKPVIYPARPVDTTTDFDGTNANQGSQASVGNGPSGSAAVVAAARQMPQQVPLMNIQRMQHPNLAFNLGAQGGMSGLHPNNIANLQRASQQAHQQVLHYPPNLRRKDPSGGMQNAGYPPQPKSRRL